MLGVTKPVPVVVDTDCWNEIDDQYALGWLLRRPDAIELLGLYAAPFHNKRSTGPADGMEKSYQEIIHLIRLAGRPELEGRTKRGATAFLPNETTPVDSEAAQDLVRLARQASPENPLTVIAIGAITNVASAILLAPEIADRLRVIWLGGHALHWVDSREFNMFQDIAAARVIFRKVRNLVQLPCMGVISDLRTTRWELEHWLKNRGPLAHYLQEMSAEDEETSSYGMVRPSRPELDELPDEERDALPRELAWSRVIWDIAAVAWLLCPEAFRSERRPRRLPGYGGRYEPVLYNGLKDFTYVTFVDRDLVFTAIFHDLTDD
ncbi:MAG: nucleoside hydrolase [Bacillota bacterium]|nr:nucleoside hydrolase [Bacillota bacterium]